MVNEYTSHRFVIAIFYNFKKLRTNDYIVHTQRTSKFQLYYFQFIALKRIRVKVVVNNIIDKRVQLL